MDILTMITDLIEPTTLICCLCVGYAIKHIQALEAYSNEFIPLTMLLLGAVVSSIVAYFNGVGVTPDVIVQGMVTGIASTGLHQLFTRTIQGLSGETTEQN